MGWSTSVTKDPVSNAHIQQRSAADFSQCSFCHLAHDLFGLLGICYFKPIVSKWDSSFFLPSCFQLKVISSFIYSHCGPAGIGHQWSLAPSSSFFPATSQLIKNIRTFTCMIMCQPRFQEIYTLYTSYLNAAF